VSKYCNIERGECIFSIQPRTQIEIRRAAVANVYAEGVSPMKIKLIMTFTLVTGLLTVCTSMFAHHGNAAYDDSKVVVLKNATVTKVNWANPHVLVFFDAKDDKGNVAHWIVEAGSPSADAPQGWTNTTLEPGDVITAYLYHAKTGRPVGRMGQLVLANGKVLTSFGGLKPEGGPANCDQESVRGGNEAAACRPGGRTTSNSEK